MTTKYDNALLKQLLADGIPTATAMEIAAIQDNETVIPTKPAETAKASTPTPAPSTSVTRSKWQPAPCTKTTKPDIDLIHKDENDDVVAMTRIAPTPERDGFIITLRGENIATVRGTPSKEGKTVMRARGGWVTLRNPASPEHALKIYVAWGHDVRTEADRRAAVEARERGQLERLKGKFGG